MIFRLSTVPPESVVIEGHADGGIVRVPRGEENVALTCVSRNAKPAPTLTWLRNDVAITQGVVTSIEDVTDSKLQVVGWNDASGQTYVASEQN